jgi:hypothetical protein
MFFSRGVGLLGEDLVDLCDVVPEHFLDALLEGGARAGAARAGAEHGEVDDAGLVVEGVEPDVAPVLLHHRPDPRADDLLYELDSLRVRPLYLRVLGWSAPYARASR